MSRPLTSGLAILGGPPAFRDALHVGRPNVGDRARLHELIDQALDRRWLTNQGPLVQELELRLAEQLEVRHCVATCNNTLGLQVVAHALGLTGEVIVPSFTFVATAHALRWLGLTPVFCDIDPATHNLDPSRVEELISPATSAIVGVHVWGRSCDVDALDGLARSHGLQLLFDAAHAFGCTHRGRPIGAGGAAEIFSFHATKFVNAFEGGAITTNDDELARRLRLARNFGFQDLDRVVSTGTNAKMSEAAAAMALTSLESIDTFVAANVRNHEAYRQGLDGLDGVTLLGHDPGERWNHQYVVLEIDEAVAGLSRDTLLQTLHAENVLARRYFFPGCHRMEPYRTEAPRAGDRLPATEALARRVLVLPTGTAVTVEDVQGVCRIIELAIEHAPLLGDLGPVD
jgi:dTDP-4-amino-4,6-dideoxygalactose transaminase